MCGSLSNHQTEHSCTVFSKVSPSYSTQFYFLGYLVTFVDVVCVGFKTFTFFEYKENIQFSLTKGYWCSSQLRHICTWSLGILSLLDVHIKVYIASYTHTLHVWLAFQWQRKISIYKLINKMTFSRIWYCCIRDLTPSQVMLPETNLDIANNSIVWASPYEYAIQWWTWKPNITAMPW